MFMVNTHELLPFSRDQLKHAGWIDEERSLDEIELPSRMMLQFEPIASFLSRFYDVSVNFENSPNLSWVAIHPMRAVKLFGDLLSHKNIMSFKASKKVELFPIGYSDIYPPWLLLMDNKGYVYGQDDFDAFSLLGYSGIHALNNLISQKQQHKPELFYRRLFPYNEIELCQKYFAHSPIMLSVGHEPLRVRGQKRDRGFEILKTLRDVGYSVYGFEPKPHVIDSRQTSYIVTDLKNLKQTPEIIYYNTPSYGQKAVEIALQLKARLIGSTWGGIDPEVEQLAKHYDIQFLRGVAFHGLALRYATHPICNGKEP